MKARITIIIIAGIMLFQQCAYALRPLSFGERRGNTAVSRAIAQADAIILEMQQEVLAWEPIVSSGTVNLANQVRSYAERIADAAEARRERLVSIEQKGGSSEILDSVSGMLAYSRKSLEGVQDLRRRIEAEQPKTVFDLMRILHNVQGGAVSQESITPDQRAALQRAVKVANERHIELAEENIFLLPEGSWFRDIFRFQNVNGMCIPMTDTMGNSVHLSLVDARLYPSRMAHVVIHERIHEEFTDGRNALKNPQESTIYKILEEATVETLALEATGEDPALGAYFLERRFLNTVCEGRDRRLAASGASQEILINYLKTGDSAQIRDVFGVNVWQGAVALTNTWKPWVDLSDIFSGLNMSFIDHRIPSYTLFLYSGPSLMSSSENADSEALLNEKRDKMAILLKAVDSGRARLHELVPGLLDRLARLSVSDYETAIAQLLHDGGLHLCDTILQAKSLDELALINVSNDSYERDLMALAVERAGVDITAHSMATEFEAQVRLQGIGSDSI